MYYTVNCKRFNKRFLPKGTTPTLTRIVGIATIQALTFTAAFAIGWRLVAGFTPLEYLRVRSKIQGRITGLTLRHDKTLQTHFLIDTMRSFGLS